MFDHEDGLVHCPYDTSTVWELIKTHFNVETRFDLLDHCYAKFDKAFYAGLCAKLAAAARNGDALCRHLFEEAGRFLGKATTALLPRVNPQLVLDGTFNIVCVGSVWKSWDLLKIGYLREVSKCDVNFGINLIQLTQAMALGAVYIAADHIKYDLPRNYSNNYEIFHYYHKTKAAYTEASPAKHTNGATLKNGAAKNGATTNGHDAPPQIQC